ncbi:MAG: hypothetical protein II612_00600 [Prevotella sp.]|nr:hypothetical protein [Prevotella sp.]
MVQYDGKNLKSWMENATSDYKSWLKNSNENERKLIVATLLHIQELAELMSHYVKNEEELKKIENAVNNIHKSMLNQ